MLALSATAFYALVIVFIRKLSRTETPTLVMLRRLQLIGWVGYQQQHLEFAREIGPRFTVDSCRLAEDYLGRFA